MEDIILSGDIKTIITVGIGVLLAKLIAEGFKRAESYVRKTENKIDDLIYDAVKEGIAKGVDKATKKTKK